MFVTTILTKNVKAFEEEANAANWHFTMDKATMDDDINDKIKQIEEMLEAGYL